MASATQRLCVRGRETGCFLLQRRGISRWGSGAALPVAATARRGVAAQREMMVGGGVVGKLGGGGVVDADSGKHHGRKQKEKQKRPRGNAMLERTTSTLVLTAAAPNRTTAAMQATETKHVAGARGRHLGALRDPALCFNSPRAPEPIPPTNAAPAASAASAAAAAIVFCVAAALPGAALAEREFYIEDIPQGLSSGESTRESRGPNLATLIKGPNGKEIEKCATKCIATCTRGGSGAPGLGPISVRKAPVVFKEGFRSRQYCLSECTEICSITVNSQKK